jgi:hypothetical protein
VKRITILLLLILVAFFLRVWQLPQIPPGLWYDEAYNALDAMWMAETNHYPVFFVGNNGREPIWHYLLLLSISLLGNIPFAVRWVGALAGVLTVPIIYRFAFSLLRPFSQNNHHRHWLALTAVGWLTVSWWHLLNSRNGFRPVLLPPLLMLSLYFFWRGWELRGTFHVSRFTFYFILAGLFLGLSQYTYLPARLAPLIVMGFAVLWSVQAFRVYVQKGRADFNLHTYGTIRQLWLGLLVTLLVAVLVFAPLGLFYFNNPDTFSSRTGDVIFAPKTFGEVTAHLLQGVSLFFGAGHELYRHHLPGRAMLGWLEIPCFWVGLISLLRPVHLRRPETQLILMGFVVMWLPALLALPPVHSLRPIGVLPFYYLIVTLGLSQAAHLIYHASRFTPQVLSNTQADHSGRTAIRNTQYVLPLALAIFITLNGLLNTYDYFQRWANHPETYKEFNTPLVDLTHHLVELTQTRDVIIPFHLYVHPTTRYLLWHTFPEQAGSPPLMERPVEMLLIPDTFQLLYVGNIPPSSALVLLTRDATGQGAVYVSRSPRAAEQVIINEGLASLQTQLRPFRDKLGRAVAHLVLLPDQDDQPTSQSQISNLKSQIVNLFDPTPLRTINLNWANLVRLEGYDVTPQLAQPGQPITLNLYWQSLTDKTFEYRLFLQLLDGAGNPLNQWEGDAFREDMYRWRPNGLLTTQHTLWLGPDTPPGPYLVRLGFFDDISGERLPLQGVAGSSPIDQVQLGLFYVSPDDTDPRQPATPLSATFADSIDLIGVTTTPYSLLSKPYAHLPVTIHWQVSQPTDKPYTVFLQLLDEQNEVVSSWDRQPFDGLYPTNLWSPNEIIADTFHLPLPEAGLPPGLYRLITGFYDFDTGQRLPVVDGGDFVELGEFLVD